jgi:hypothetical protein
MKISTFIDPGNERIFLEAPGRFHHPGSWMILKKEYSPEEGVKLKSC